MRNLRIIILLAAVIFPGTGLQSQSNFTTKSRKAIDAYNQGLRSYNLNKYADAEKQFLAAINEDPGFLEAYLVLAEVYEDAHKPLDAIDYYRKAFQMNPGYYPYGYIRLGNLQYREGMYEEAKISYEQYLGFNIENKLQAEKAKDGIVRCIFSIQAKSNPVDFKPVNLGPAINTANDEYWPSLSADEQILVITRMIKLESYSMRMQEDFFISHWKDGQWGVMTNAGSPLNSKDNEGAQTISGDGRFMVFTACNRSDAVGRCDLYFSTREGDTWSVPRNMGKPVNTAFRETQPSLSADGRTLYFSSDRSGGKGQHDIWVTRLDESDRWTEPVNLGDSINTDGEELSPYIHLDGQSLYFSSDGQVGLGGYDLFISQLNENGQWGKAINLGYPINTHRDEMGLVVNSRGDRAYYSSDMQQENGKDIFIFELPQQDRPDMVTYMKGRVFDAATRKALKATFELIDLETRKETNRSQSDSITGEFLVSIPTDHNFLLNVSKDGYLFYSENFSMKGIYYADHPFLKDIPLHPLKAGVSIILKNVFYETDSFTLKKESEIELMKVVDFLKENPAIKIEISGHTDNTGNLEYNQRLSENRAKTVADYLIQASIDESRIIYRGYGMKLPVAPNDTEENRSQNRRTELKIIE